VAHQLQKTYQEAERSLQEERATLTRFDDEVADLEQVIKDKRDAATEADLLHGKLEHEMETLKKDRTASTTKVRDLEKLYSWITEEKKSVSRSVILLGSS
jgi:structural maintenance of chromosome 2